MDAIVDQSDFAPGDHLKVRRYFLDLLPYWHHGVYDGAGNVVDFGSGVWDGVARKTLEEFQDDSPSIDIERHGRATLGTGYLFEADEPDKIVARARFLLDASPFPQRYDVIGLNCEHIANWCVVGSYCESHQTRATFRIKAYVSAVFLIYLSMKERRGLQMSRGDLAFAVLSCLVGLIVRWIYNRQIKEFYAWAEPAWAQYRTENGIG